MRKEVTIVDFMVHGQGVHTTRALTQQHCKLNPFKKFTVCSEA